MSEVDYLQARSKALQQYDAAFHLLNVTFPLVNDPKLLIGVVHNIFSSMEASMGAIMAYERKLHLIPPYYDNFESKFNLFRHKTVPRNNISSQLVESLGKLKELLDLHKKSPMEFQRGQKFVICTKEFQMQSLTFQEIRNYLYQSKEFIHLMEQIIPH